MGVRRLAAVSLSLLVGLACLASFVMLTAHASPGVNDRTGDQPVSVSAPDMQSFRSNPYEVDPAGYWTEEKMRAAIFADRPASELSQAGAYRAGEVSVGVGEGENLSDPVGPELSAGQQSRSVVVPSTAGKVFFTYKGRDYVCSGSAINGSTKNVVATAGHCVHGGKGEGWHENIAFAPAYHNGLSVHGIWNWSAAHTFQGWINSSDNSRDQAFFTVHPRNGKSLVATVGGNGISYNFGHNQTGVRVWGWPAEAPYNGATPYYCDGNTKKRGLFSSDMIIACDMTAGASGGPWLREGIDANLGYVFGVTSRRTTSGAKALISTPFDSAVKNLFEGIG